MEEEEDGRVRKEGGGVQEEEEEGGMYGMEHEDFVQMLNETTRLRRELDLLEETSMRQNEALDWPEEGSSERRVEACRLLLEAPRFAPMLLMDTDERGFFPGGQMLYSKHQKRVSVQVVLQRSSHQLEVQPAECSMVASSSVSSPSILASAAFMGSS